MADVAQEEAATGNSARARKAFSLIFTGSTNLTAPEHAMRARIAQVLFPAGPATQSEDNDVQIVFHAWKNRCTLITNDGGSRSQPGGILGHRSELAGPGSSVITDAEAVSWVEEQICNRDDRERRWSEMTGEPLPDWVGND